MNNIIQDQEENTKRTQRICNWMIIGLILLLCLLLCLWTPSSAYANGFDVTVAGKALFDPMMKFILDWYKTAIFASGLSGAMIAQGDLKTRAFGFGGGALLAGLSVWAVKAGFGL